MLVVITLKFKQRGLSIEEIVQRCRWNANSVDLDQTALEEQPLEQSDLELSDLDLPCLLRPICPKT